jgi:hypothetical protein
VAVAPKLDRGDVQLKRVRALCADLAGVEERMSHGTPTFFAGKVFAMFVDNLHGDGRLAVWVPVAEGLQERLIEEDSRRYFRPPYVGVKGWIGIELGRIDDETLAIHLREAWRQIGGARPKRSRKGLASR